MSIIASCRDRAYWSIDIFVAMDIHAILKTESVRNTMMIAKGPGQQALMNTLMGLHAFIL